MRNRVDDGVYDLLIAFIWSMPGGHLTTIDLSSQLRSTRFRSQRSQKDG